MARLAVLLAFLSGCAQLFGLDETSGRSVASLTVERVSIGATLERSPQDLSAFPATYLVPDETEPTGLRRVTATQDAVGTWSAPLGAPAPMLFDLPDFPMPITRLFDFPQAEVKTLFGVMEHPNPVPALPEDMLTVNVNLDVPYAGEGLQLYTVGTWTVRGLEAPAAGAGAVAPPPFPVSSMSAITGRPIERITAKDGAVVLRYVGNQLVGAFEAPAFDQTGNDTITGTMTTVTLEPLEFTIDQAAAAMRYTAVRPLVGAPTMAWYLRAAPGAQLNNDNGPLLHAAGVAMTDPTTVTSMFGNPFAARGWQTSLLWLTEATRTYTPPSAGLPVTLYAGMHERAVPTAGIAMRLPAGLPELITLDGRSLSTDGLSLPKPARAVEVSFVTDTADNTLYQVQLYKLVPNAANTALAYQQKLAGNAVEPSFTLPPELFEAGALYTIRAIAVKGGFPGIAEGDLTQREIPISLSFLDSGVFQVTP